MHAWLWVFCNWEGWLIVCYGCVRSKHSSCTCSRFQHCFLQFISLFVLFIFSCFLLRISMAVFHQFLQLQKASSERDKLKMQEKKKSFFDQRIKTRFSQFVHKDVTSSFLQWTNSYGTRTIKTIRRYICFKDRQSIHLLSPPTRPPPKKKVGGWGAFCGRFKLILVRIALKTRNLLEMEALEKTKFKLTVTDASWILSEK